MKSETKPKKPQLSKSKIFIFKLGAFGIAILILLALEGVLRLSGYGHDYHLFVEDKNDSSKLVMNPEVSKKYFGDTENATSGIPKTFRKKKEPNTFRVFVLGASTAIGYPYRYHGGFHHWLEYGLNRTYPNQKFEIINLSLTAINSYTLLDFTKQIVDYEPDAVLVYAGHNEYYGALGVASTSSLGKNPWMVNTFINLKTFRTTQLIENAFASIKTKTNESASDNETLMKKMVQDQKIPLDSQLFYHGIDQFESNFKDMLQYLIKKKIPTFMGTLVSNIRDVKPFLSDTTNNETSAKFWYNKGQVAYDEKEFVVSKLDFIKAKELDMLRFRAPERMNNIIKALALEHDNVTLVNSFEDMETHSPNRIVGNELLLEHVHPNIKGYSVLAFSFYKALTESKLIKREPHKIFDFSELWEQTPITVLDSVTGNYEILMLKEGWPYYEPIPAIDPDSLSLPELIAGRLAVQNISWDEASQLLYKFYLDEGDDLNALKVIEAATLRYPDDSKYYEMAGDIASNLGQSEKVFYLYQRAFSIDKSMEMAKRISRNLIENGFYNESLKYLDHIKMSEPENTFANQLYDISKSIISLQKQESKINSNPEIGIQLAENFILIGNKEKALLYLKIVLNDYPNNEKAVELMKKIN